VPLAGSEPLQPPEAVQAVALVELQLSAVVPPTATDVGFALIVAVGTTLTPALMAGLEPPGPLQVRINIEFWVRGPVL